MRQLCPQDPRLLPNYGVPAIAAWVQAVINAPEQQKVVSSRVFSQSEIDDVEFGRPGGGCLSSKDDVRYVDDVSRVVGDFAIGETGMVGAATGDARFFSRSGPYPLAVVAKAAGGITRKLDLVFDGVAPLQTAGPKSGQLF